MQTTVGRPVLPNVSAPSILTGRSVLVTGGSGAFGQAFVRRCLADGARRVVVYSRGEAKQAAMRSAFADTRLRFFIGDIRDAERLTQAMRDVDVVVHAAALKRVEVCQGEPGEAMKTNIVGTYNVAQAAIACGAQRCVFLSTDKSASPSTVYGASKLFGEGLWNAMNELAAGTPTKFACTRYGNVINSTGSVVPLWREQAARGEPLTITDRRMTRFLMPMAAAMDLVVLALEEMNGGEVFIPLLKGARMVDLAAAIAPDAQLSEIGMRGVEKIHETLISDDEIALTERLEKCYIITPSGTPDGAPVPASFRYRSDTVEPMSVEELQVMLR